MKLAEREREREREREKDEKRALADLIQSEFGSETRFRSENHFGFKCLHEKNAKRSATDWFSLLL